MAINGHYVPKIFPDIILQYGYNREIGGELFGLQQFK